MKIASCVSQEQLLRGMAGNYHTKIFMYSRKVWDGLLWPSGIIVTIIVSVLGIKLSTSCFQKLHHLADSPDLIQC